MGKLVTLLVLLGAVACNNQEDQILSAEDAPKPVPVERLEAEFDLYYGFFQLQDQRAEVPAEPSFSGSLIEVSPGHVYVSSDASDQPVRVVVERYDERVDLDSEVDATEPVTFAAGPVRLFNGLSEPVTEAQLTLPGSQELELSVSVGQADGIESYLIVLQPLA